MKQKRKHKNTIRPAAILSLVRIFLCIQISFVHILVYSRCKANDCADFHFDIDFRPESNRAMYFCMFVSCPPNRIACHLPTLFFSYFILPERCLFKFIRIVSSYIHIAFVFFLQRNGDRNLFVSWAKEKTNTQKSATICQILTHIKSRYERMQQREKNIPTTNLISMESTNRKLKTRSGMEDDSIKRNEIDKIAFCCSSSASTRLLIHFGWHSNIRKDVHLLR